MANYTAGSVNAKITLDTKEFNEAIGKLKEEVGQLKDTFNGVKGTGLSKEIEKLKEEINSLKTTNENYRKTIDNLRKSQKNRNNVVKDATSVEREYNEAIVKLDKSTKNLKNTTDQLANSERKLGENGVRGRNNVGELGRSEAEEIQRLLNVVNKATIALERLAKAKGKVNAVPEPDMRGQFYSLHTQLSSWLPDSTSLAQAMENVDQKIMDAYHSFGQFFRLLPSGFKSAQEAAEQYRQRVGLIADELKAKWHAMSVELAQANAAQYKYWKQVRGSADVEGYNQLKPLQFSYNDYLQQDASKMAAEVEKWEKAVQSGARTSLEFKETLVQLAESIKLTGSEMNRFAAQSERVVSSMSVMGKTNELANKLRKVGMELNHFSSLSTKNKNALAKLSEQTLIYKDKLNVLETAFKKGDITLETFDAELTKLAEKFKLLGASTQQTIRELSGGNAEMNKMGANARNMGRGITSFNNGIVQTAHSGRILSNTLYQIRGALLSLKMIFTATGAMMLWGFAMDIGESVKETVTAKNEMEAQLNQALKGDTAGIQSFQKALDELPKTFKKVNKYAVGETVSSIGLEFNLSAKQMKKALPIVTMIQSEYVRAGRKTSEAALAVKDILQGEFQRLSRETGVGKEELIAYGWDEDKENIDGLLKALQKAALDRHWDVFAKKATSLNDVLEITKSRFSEFGADMIDSITPLIVGGFNTLIDTIVGVQKAFNGLGSFWQNFTLFGGGIGLFGGILTALPMVTKGMGLAEIATLGWKKSIATAILNLNKAEVNIYGFRKALAAVIAGTKASELADVRWSKAIMGRILGLKQATLAEHGYWTALVKSKMQLSTYGPVMSDASIAAMNLRQKIIYLAKGELVADKASATWGKTIKSLITSTKLWRIALLGITGIALTGWLAGMAAWTDVVKKRVENYNDVLTEGKDKIKEYEGNVETYTNNLAKQKEELTGLTKGTAKYNKKLQEIELTQKNLDTSTHNVDDMKLAYKLAKDIKKENKETARDNDAMLNRGLESIYSANGVKNVEKYGKEYQKMKYVAYDLKKAEEERYKFEYASQQHINEHVKAMKEAGVSEKDRVKYITEYNTKAEEAAKHLKEFNQGDLTAGAYYVMDRLALMWIDLWNDKDFITFWNTVKKTFEDLKPILNDIKDGLLGIGRTLINFFSTDSGRWVGVIAIAAGAFGILAWKLKGVFDKAKDAVGGLKDVWKWLRKTKDVPGTDKDTPDGKAPTTVEGGTIGGVEKGKFWETVGQDARNTGRSMFKYAGYIAAATVLVTEAIVLIQAPMLALAWTGQTFKAKEKSIRAGIEGLQLVAPTIIALLIPIMALIKVMDMWGDKIMNWKTLGATVVGIAAGMLLVAEAIFMLKVPMMSLSAIGKDYAIGKKDIEGGITAMQVMGDSLKYLVPFVPIFLVGIALAAACFAAPEVGLLATGAVIAGIALGMVMLAEAVVTLRLPLEAIRELGNSFTDIEGAKKGAEALRITAESMKYVEDAMTAMTLVHWELIANAVAQLIGITFDIKLTDLTAEGGFLDELKQFVEEFSKYELEIPSGFQDKVTALKTAGESVGAIGDAMLLAKQAMDNLPDEFKNGGASLTYDMETDTSTIKTDQTVQGYFDTFKEPIKQLKQFVDDFNNSDEFNIEPIDGDRVANISSAANMITQINTAVENVKTAMANVGGSQWNTSYAEGGILAAVGNWLYHSTGAGSINNGASSGSYKSSLGSSLQQMEDIVSDMFTFQSNISKYTSEGGEGADVSGLGNMVTVVQQAISNLSQSLSDAVPTLKANGNSLGSAIISGFKEGTTGLSSLGIGIPTQIANGVMSGKETLYATSSALGKTTASKFKDGVNPMSDYMTWELFYVGKAMDDQKESLGQKAYDLGSYIASRFKEGDDINSPGIMARSMQDEINYIGGYLSTNNLPQMAFDLANALSSNFKLDFNLGNFQIPDLTQWGTQLSGVIPIVDNLKTQVSTKFGEMRTNVQTSFSNILNNNRTSMSSMKVATISNIGAIKTSWRGMQDALIASAEHIRSQTTSKIDKLKTNMGDFWNKIKNPDQLIGSAGGKPTGTIPQRRPFRGFAGAPLFKPKISKKDPSDYEEQGLLCRLLTGAPCYSGGWDFNWSPQISSKFKGWGTHFNKFNLDSHLNVGKFENSNFPVKGQLDVFKDYVSAVIASTNYDYYYDSRYSPVEALRRGAFNCWDGTQIILAIARAFGITGGGIGHGTWGSDGHVWATIPGIGVIDPTAIQRGYGFRSPKVKGYAGGRSSGSNPTPNKKINNHNEVHIHIEGDVYGVDDLNAKIEEGANRVARQLFRNSYSGV